MRFVLFLSLLFFFSCSSPKPGIRVGVDPTWAPLDFEKLQPFVNGYTDELLLEVAKSSGLTIEKVGANSDSIGESLRDGKYDAVLTSMPPYAFNTAKYDFSQDFLKLGPVLIGTAHSRYSSLEELSGELVGLLSQDPAILLIEKYPEIIVRNFDSIPELLDAVALGDVEAALVDRLFAIGYVKDLYAGHLKIISEPLTDAGLHLIALKGKSSELIRSFDKTIKQLKKKKKLSELQQKWNLTHPD